MPISSKMALKNSVRQHPHEHGGALRQLIFSNTTSSCNHNIFQSRSQSFQPKKNSTYSITVPIITNMADATTEPKVAPAETEKPLQVEAKDEAPKETPPVCAISP